MAFAPANHTPNKSRLFSARKPNYKDFSGPPNGDYARYVDELMAWAAQEQESQRLKNVSDKARQSDSTWGRGSDKSSIVNQPMAQPGSVDSAVERLKRKAQAQAVKFQQQAQKKAPGMQQSAAQKKPFSKVKGFNLLAVFAGFVLTSIVAPSLTPFVLLAWVVYSVISAVRTASRSGKS